MSRGGAGSDVLGGDMGQGQGGEGVTPFLLALGRRACAEEADLGERGLC